MATSLLEGRIWNKSEKLLVFLDNWDRRELLKLQMEKNSLRVLAVLNRSRKLAVVGDLATWGAVNTRHGENVFWGLWCGVVGFFLLKLAVFASNSTEDEQCWTFKLCPSVRPGKSSISKELCPCYEILVCEYCGEKWYWVTSPQDKWVELTTYASPN